MKRLLILLAMMATIQLASAQMYAVRDGERCIVHDIMKGNTLYGIGKMYAVEVEDIIASNEWASDGLSIGETLFIPVKYVDSKAAKKSPELKGNVLAHKVRKGETMFSLSKRYNIDINALIEANPDLGGVIKKNQTIYIPTEQIDNVPEVQITPAAQDSLLSHLVGTGETLFSISRMYEVTIEEVLEVNEGLADGLNKGDRIRIPRYREDFVPAGMASMTGSTVVDTLPDLGFESAPQRDVRIGLMLPFSINTASTDGDKDKGLYQMTDIAFEFYRGVRMALEEMTDRGLNSEVIVFDVDKRAGSALSAVSRSEFDDLDLIIGPLHRTSFSEVAKSATKKGIPSVSPLTSSRSVIVGNDMACKVATSDQQQADYLAKYLYVKHAGSTIHLLKNSLEKDKAIYEAFEQSWQEMKQPGDSTRLLRYSMEDYEEEDFVEQLDTLRSIVLAVPSGERPFVSDLMTKLTSSRFSNMEMTVYGLEEWLKYENIDAHIKNRFNMRLCASKYIDYDLPEVKRFMSEYYDRYNTIPSAQGYSLIAYDVTHYYMMGLLAHGPAFVDHLDLFRGEGMETGFDFVRAKGGGWENRYCFMLRYDDYELVREN